MRLFVGIVVALMLFVMVNNTGMSMNNIPKTVFDINYVVKATCYHATIKQCDSTPFKTASGARINKRNPGLNRYVALSRDMIRPKNNRYLKSGYNLNGPFKYGDIIIVSDAGPDLNGEWKVVDTMARRYKNRIDFLVNKGDKPEDFSSHMNVRIKRKYQV